MAQDEFFETFGSFNTRKTLRILANKYTLSVMYPVNPLYMN
jgi:hypothetical protein